MFPAPHVGFLVVASTAATYAQAAFIHLSSHYAAALHKKYTKDGNRIFYRLSSLFTLSTQLLLPIVVRRIG
ncbi:MAG TPA: hypothetical protein VHK67_07215 [Rhabdochlamydiaceae bacterium]|nr:hypothetical protein [Rhabdochlamydiaceae bacterium]